MQRRLECIVHGEVQGVSFRAFTVEVARELGLVGFVRNRSDDTVEVVAEGKEVKLLEFIEQLTTGYRFARVERIDKAWGEPTGAFTDFRVTR